MSELMDISYPMFNPSSDIDRHTKTLEKQFNRVFSSFVAFNQTSDRQNQFLSTLVTDEKDFYKADLALSKSRNTILATLDKDLLNQTTTINGIVSDVKLAVVEMSSKVDEFSKSLVGVENSIKELSQKNQIGFDNMYSSLKNLTISPNIKVENDPNNLHVNIAAEDEFTAINEVLTQIRDELENISDGIMESFLEINRQLSENQQKTSSTIDEGFFESNRNLNQIDASLALLGSKMENISIVEPSIVEEQPQNNLESLESIEDLFEESNEKLDLIYETVSRRLTDISFNTGSSNNPTSDDLEGISDSITRGFSTQSSSTQRSAGLTVSGIISGFRQIMPEVASVLSFNRVGELMKEQMNLQNYLARHTGQNAKQAGFVVSDIRDEALGDYGAKFSLEDKNRALESALDAGISNYEQLVGATKDLALTAKLLPGVTLDLTEGYAKDLLVGYDNGAETIQGVAMVMKEYSDNMYVSASTLQRAVTKYGNTVYGLSDSMTTYMQKMDQYIKNIAVLDQNGLNNLNITETIDYFHNTALSDWSADKLTALSLMGIDAGEFDKVAQFDPEAAQEMLLQGFKDATRGIDVDDYGGTIRGREIAKYLNVKWDDLTAALNGKIDRAQKDMANTVYGAEYLSGNNDEETTKKILAGTADTIEEQIAQTWDEVFKNKIEDFMVGNGILGDILNTLNSIGIGGGIVAGVGGLLGGLGLRRIGSLIMGGGAGAAGAAAGGAAAAEGLGAAGAVGGTAAGGGILATLRGGLSRTWAGVRNIGSSITTGIRNGFESLRSETGIFSRAGMSGTAKFGLGNALGLVQMGLDAGGGANRAAEWTGRDSEATRISSGLAGAIAGTGGGLFSSDSVGKQIGDVAGGALKGAAIGSIIPGVGTAIGAAIGGALSAIGGSRIGTILGGIAKGAEDFNEGLNNFLSSHLGNVGDALVNLKDGILGTVSKPLSGLMEGLGEITGGLGKAGQKLMGGHPIQAVGEVLGGAVKGAGKVVGGVVKGVGSFVGGAVKGIGSLFGIGKKKKKKAEEEQEGNGTTWKDLTANIAGKLEELKKKTGQTTSATDTTSTVTTSSELDTLKHTDWEVTNVERGQTDLTGANPYAFTDTDLTQMPGDMTPVEGIPQQENPMTGSILDMPEPGKDLSKVGEEPLSEKVTENYGEDLSKEKTEGTSLGDTIYNAVSRVFEDYKNWYTGGVSSEVETPEEKIEDQKDETVWEKIFGSIKEKLGLNPKEGGVFSKIFDPIKSILGISSEAKTPEEKIEDQKDETVWEKTLGSLKEKFGLNTEEGSAFSKIFDPLKSILGIPSEEGKAVAKEDKSYLDSFVGLNTDIIDQIFSVFRTKGGITSQKEESTKSISNKVVGEDTELEVSLADILSNLEISVTSRLDKIIANTNKPISIPQQPEMIRNVNGNDIRNYA